MLACIYALFTINRILKSNIDASQILYFSTYLYTIYLMVLINQIYTDNFTKERMDENLTEKYPVEKGVRQGDPLGPFLFNFLMNNLLKQLENKAVHVMNGKMKILYVIHMILL